MRETTGGSTLDLYPIYDGSGHVVGLVDNANNLLASYCYGPYGELLHSSGSHAQSNPWRYATKYYDTETNLYYFGYRYYDNVTCQWLSREPLGEDESLNLYAYCHNDPINKVDVLGLKPLPTHVLVRTEVDVDFKEVKAKLFYDPKDFAWERTLSDDEVTIDKYVKGAFAEGSTFVEASDVEEFYKKLKNEDKTIILGYHGLGRADTKEVNCMVGNSVIFKEEWKKLLTNLSKVETVYFLSLIHI